MKKRILGTIIFIILICYFTVVHAAEDVTLTSSSDTAKQGDTITITVAASNNSGLNGINSEIEYDSNILELVECKLVDEENWSEYDSFPKLTAMWKTSGKDTKTADIYAIKFKVKSIGTTKSTNVKLKGITLSLNTANDITVGDITKTITLESTTNPSNSPSPSNSPTNSPAPSNSNGGSTVNNSNSNSSSNNQNNAVTKQPSQVAQTGTQVGTTTTKATENIPKTGSKIMPIFIKVLIAILFVVSIIFYKKCKKYIDI